MTARCPFCKIDARHFKIVFETINFKFIRSFRSQFPDHFYLITATHVPDEFYLDSYQWTEYGHATRRIYEYFKDQELPTPITFILPEKDEAFPHFHKHFLPGVFSSLKIQEALVSLLPKT